MMNHGTSFSDLFPVTLIDQDKTKMTGPSPSITAVSARWLVAAAVVLASAFNLASAKATRTVARHDGSWTVMIITEAGSCDQAYSFPVQIVGNRVMSSSGTATITGQVGPSGSVAVRVSSGGSFANGTGRLGAGSGAGRWSGKGSAGACSGRWQATRS
jgi:uncharacterized membrane protein YgcG